METHLQGEKIFTEKKVHSSWIVHIKFASISEKSEDKQQKKKLTTQTSNPLNQTAMGVKAKMKRMMKMAILASIGSFVKI